MDQGIRKVSRMLVAIAMLSLCGCMQQLKDLNSTLTKTNAAVAQGSTMPNMPEMSELQRQTLHSKLVNKVNDRAIHQAREEARPVIEKILEISACYPRFDIGRYLNAYSVAENSGAYGHSAPMVMMNYHPKSECLTVSRVDSWRMLAKNALSFRAVFVSDASSESSSVNYEMIKQPDGTWLLR